MSSKTSEVRQVSIDSFLVKKTKKKQKSLEDDQITDDVETFFNDKCAEAFQSTESDSNVEELCSNYKETLKINEVQLKHAKKLLKESAKIILEKELLIKNLEEKIAVPSNDQRKKDLFKKFENKFDWIDLENLRSVKPGAKFDSTFVLNLVRLLYGSDLSKLKNKSVTGKIYKGERKDPLTPEKKSLITEIIKERISSEQDNTAAQRMKQISRHMRAAIYNINNTSNAKLSKPQEMNLAPDPPHEPKEISSTQQEMFLVSNTTVYKFQYAAKRL